MIEGTLPPEYAGSEFGPGLQCLARMLYFQGRVPQEKIHLILTGMDVSISLGQISNILTQIPLNLTQERNQVREAAVSKAKHVQCDDTGAKINNQSAYTIVSCNEYFTDFYTSSSKSRLSVLHALQGADELMHYRINRTVVRYLTGKIAKKYLSSIESLAKTCADRVFVGKEEFDQKLLKRLSFLHLPEQLKDELELACAIAGYRRLKHRPLAIVSDDAGNYKAILRYHGLCWVHEIRKYRELMAYAYSSYQQEELNKYLTKVRALYRRIRTYQRARAPNPKEPSEIEKTFDELFGTPIGHRFALHSLDELMKQTKKRKTGLLLGLRLRFLPLENNESERDLRERVIKRRISGGNHSQQGVQAWDTYLSLMITCRKLNVSYWEYLKDRAMLTNRIPPLAQIIRNLP